MSIMGREFLLSAGILAEENEVGKEWQVQVMSSDSEILQNERKDSASWVKRGRGLTRREREQRVRGWGEDIMMTSARVGEEAATR